MSIEEDTAGSGTDPEVSQSRMQLIWDVVVFQFKLAADGIRDVALVPVSLIAALAGLILGGRHPAKYYQAVLKFGRRTEHWINLFGYRHRGGTADDIIRPIQDRVFEEAENNPWLQKAGNRLDRTLDNVGQAIANNAQSKQEPSSQGDKPSD